MEINFEKDYLKELYENGKARIEFITTLEGEEPNSITICSIIELSNHYK